MCEDDDVSLETLRYGETSATPYFCFQKVGIIAGKFLALRPLSNNGAELEQNFSLVRHNATRFAEFLVFALENHQLTGSGSCG